MPDVEINLGQCFTATGTSQKYVPTQKVDQGFRRGSIKNNGTVTVFFGWNKDVTLVSDADEADKGYAAPGEAIRVPRRCSFFHAVTAGAAAKCIYVED